MTLFAVRLFAMTTAAKIRWLPIVVVILCGIASAQTAPYQRTFPQSKAAIEKTLSTMQNQLAGRLPVLEGFAKPGDYPLNRYRRGYYQAAFEIISANSGECVVHVTANVTAWYADPSGSHSGYQLLTSNGRIEADLLDQLADQLAGIPPPSGNKPAPPLSPSVETAAAFPKPAVQPSISAPSIPFPDTNQTFSSSLSHGLGTAQPAKDQPPQPVTAEKAKPALQAEADNLAQVLQGMAHPNNLVAVKKSGTPVVATPSINAKPEFLASAHDEFELLDFNADWVHVRISGLSRGWIWRNSVEMPEGISNTQQHSEASPAPAADLFHVSREETAPFPGDWPPLRSKTVKIISVQKADQSAKDTTPQERLEYTKSLLEKNYSELSAKPDEAQGIVVIFDSADGGMIAAAAPTLQQWKAGALSDQALWHQCFFDPPETFDSAATSGSR